MNAQDLNRLLDELRRAGEEPDQALLDRVKAHGQATVRPLIEMAVDEKLYQADSESPEFWAPIHAVQLLGELGAPEAVEPLLTLLGRDDDCLADDLPKAFGGIGAPAMAPLRGILFDRTTSRWARIWAATSLARIGQRHRETRPEVVSALVARLDPAESRTPEDEIITAFVISALLDLKAVEAEAAIRRAFQEDRVDTSIVDLNWALVELGLPAEPEPAGPAERDGMRLKLRCTACHYERVHDVGTVYCDVPTMERHRKGEETPYSECVITRRITCPKCGAVDQYELTGEAFAVLAADMMKKLVAQEAGEPGAGPGEGELRLIRFRLTDGREMHPLAAREVYRQEVAAKPDRADLRVRYANVLSFLGYPEDAAEQYRAALRLESSNLEAYLRLGRLANDAGNVAEARQMFESMLKHAPGSNMSREDREEYMEAAVEELAKLGGPSDPSGLLPSAAPQIHPTVSATRGAETARPGPPPRAVRKVGRNEPCPCGSGRKYKRCHGR